MCVWLCVCGTHSWSRGREFNEPTNNIIVAATLDQEGGELNKCRHMALDTQHNI